MPARATPADGRPAPIAAPAPPADRGWEGGTGTSGSGSAASLLWRTGEMEAVLRALPDLFVRLDADGVVLEHRAGSAALPDGVAGGLLGRRLQEVLPEDVGGRLGVALAEARRTGRPTFFGWTVQGEQGGREVEGRVVPTGGRQAILLVREATERTAAVRALRAGEEHLRRLTENATDMVQIVGADGRIVYTGPSVQHLLGYAPEALAGTLATDYIHPDDVAHVVAGMGAMLANPGVFFRDEYRVRHADGTWRLFEGNCRTLSPTSPDEGIVVNARDITDRKRAEDALRQSEERWRTVIANTHDIISVLDAEGRVTFQSPAFERVLGYSEADMLGRSAFDLVHPEDVAATLTALRQILEQPGSTGHAEYRYRHRDGHWRRLETFGRTLLPDSPRAGMVFNSRDVTERWEAAERLRRSEEHFRALAENASDLISVLDAEGRYTYQSPALGQLLGWRADEVLGRAPWEFMHPDDLSAAQAALRHMVAAPGTSHTVQYRCRHRDGSWRVLESTGRTLLPHSAADGIVAISRDVTARRQVEEALRQATADAERAREEAERANLAKSEFLSRMSHELRTPLNSILGFAQLLDGAELPARLHKGVQHILTAGEHLLNLINEVLDIARIESGRQQLSIEPVRLATVLQEAVGLVRPLASARGVWVSEASDASADGWVRADRQRLAQVLLNLLSNAVKYNRPGGRVRLACEAADDGGVSVRVEDTGRGIPAERVDELFVPFARLGAERTEVEGTGLGLALSRRLVEAMGGRLSLERTSELGSVFRVELRGAEDPVHDAAGQLAAETAVPTGPHGVATLLYVEDNLANLTLVEQILESRPGWRLLPALQGRLGLELACEHAPDVVLLDLHLPDISGEEVLRQLRADARTATTPVIVISADATPKTVERLRAAGADGYLTKPLRVQQFLSVVADALRGHPA